MSLIATTLTHALRGAVWGNLRWHFVVQQRIFQIHQLVLLLLMSVHLQRLILVQFVEEVLVCRRPARILVLTAAVLPMAVAAI